MKSLVFIFIILFHFQAFSDLQVKEIAEKQTTAEKPSLDEGYSFGEVRLPLISPYYRQGDYLIYDCEDHHFACVDKKSFDQCAKWRKKAIDLVKEFMPCAPLKKFDSVALCNKEHYLRIYSKTFKRFCIRTKKNN